MGQLVYDNQRGDDKRITIIKDIEYPKSDNVWSFQVITDLQGEWSIQDVFEYGDYYVILKPNGSKIQVIHDSDVHWHIAKQGE